MALTKIVPSKGRKAPSGELRYLGIFRASSSDRIGMIRRGIPAVQAKQIASDLNVEQKSFFQALNLKTATLNRKAARNDSLPADESERLLGVARLVGQVQAIVEESGDPQDFDAPEWLSAWLREPLPALGGARPFSLLDTMEGQAMVSDALSKIQSGAYA